MLGGLRWKILKKIIIIKLAAAEGEGVATGVDNTDELLDSVVARVVTLIIEDIEEFNLVALPFQFLFGGTSLLLSFGFVILAVEFVGGFIRVRLEEVAVGRREEGAAGGVEEVDDFDGFTFGSVGRRGEGFGQFRQRLFEMLPVAAVLALEIAASEEVGDKSRPTRLEFLYNDSACKRK